MHLFITSLILLMRLDKPIGIWLVFFPASWSVLLANCPRVGPEWAILFACFVGAVLTRSAGCIMNDIADRRLDAQVARTRTRPLAAGTVSVRAALALLFILLLLSLGLALILPPTVLYVALLAVPMMALYPLMKRITWWPQMFLGLTFNLSALIGWAAVTDAIAPAAWWLYVGAVFWTFGYDTLYAHQDRTDDTAIGIKSSARALGDSTVRVVGFSYALFIACLTMAGGLLDASWPYFAGVCAASVHLSIQLLRCDIENPALMGKLFRSNAWVGALIAVGVWASHLSIAL
jgi:4-hydroxybenzoate polyprenyltransferase